MERLTGSGETLQTSPAWKDLLVFNEYFHGDNGAGLGASHQTGWTALVVDLILDPPGAAGARPVRGSRAAAEFSDAVLEAGTARPSGAT